MSGSGGYGFGGRINLGGGCINMVGLFLFFCLSDLRAAPVTTPLSLPETVVEISVFDLAPPGHTGNQKSRQRMTIKKSPLETKHARGQGKKISGAAGTESVVKAETAKTSQKVEQEKKPESEKKQTLSKEYLDQVLQLLNENLSALSQCNDAGTGVRTDVTRLKAEIVIDSSGTPKVEVGFLEGFDNATQRNCVKNVLAKISFPKHEIQDGVHLTWPIHMKQEKI